MLVTKFLLAAAAFTLASSQAVQFTNSDFSGIKVGVAFNITWSGASSDIALKLKNGPKDTQNLVSDIATGVSGTSFSWVPASTLAPGTYNLEIDHGSDPPNYSVQFQITGGSGSSSAASGSSTAAPPSVTSSAPSGSSTITTTSTALTSSASGKSNSTTTTTVASNTTASVTTTVSRASGTSTSTAIPSANNAAQYASPFAFVLLSLAAMAALN